MGIYESLTADQVVAFYRLVNFLRRLRVIGVFYAKTIPAVQTVDVFGQYDAMNMASIYGIQKLGYDSNKSMMDVEERLEKMFGERPKPRFTSLRGLP